MPQLIGPHIVFGPHEHDLITYEMCWGSGNSRETEKDILDLSKRRGPCTYWGKENFYRHWVKDHHLDAKSGRWLLLTFDTPIRALGFFPITQNEWGEVAP